MREQLLKRVFVIRYTESKKKDVLSLGVFLFQSILTEYIVVDNA